jgi:hypothetical protein
MAGLFGHALDQPSCVTADQDKGHGAVARKVIRVLLWMHFYVLFFSSLVGVSLSKPETNSRCQWRAAQVPAEFLDGSCPLVLRGPATNSSGDHSRSVTFAAIAGETRVVQAATSKPSTHVVETVKKGK